MIYHHTMRTLPLIPLLSVALPSMAQWTREEALPDTIPSITAHGDTLFVGGISTTFQRVGHDAPWQAWATIPGQSVYIDALAHFDGVLFAGTGGASMFRSADAASPWITSPGLTGLGAGSVSCIAAFHGSLYCGTAGGGTFRLVGGSWQPFGTLGDDQANNVYFMRAIGDTLWCGAGGNGYLFHITAGDSDWTPMPVDVVSGPSIEFTDLIAVPGALVAGGTMGTYRSTDQGANWTWTAGPAAVVKFTWWNDVLIASRTGAATRWFRSDNGGLSWSVFSETTLSFAHAVHGDRFYSGQLDGLWYMEDLPTGMPEGLPPSFELYPNPAHDVVMIRSAGAIPERIEVTDLQGRTVLTAPATSSIELTGLAPGGYVVRSVLGGASMSQRLIVH